MNYKSKRSKATDIDKQTRMAVAVRDNGHCIICGRPGMPNAHFIPRSQGGLGIEQNIVTLCPNCHHDFDNGFKHKEYYEVIEQYLKSFYGDCWAKERLIYRKG